MDICPSSGTPLKTIPAGVSKSTGKPYDSFVVCEVKGCKGPHIPGATYSTPKPVQAPPRATQSFTEPFTENREQYGKRLAIHGMVNGLLAGGIPPTEVTKLLPELINLENQINIHLNGTADIVNDIPF